MSKLKKVNFKILEKQKEIVESSEIIKQLFTSPADFYRRAIDEKLERLGLLNAGIYNGEINEKGVNQK